MAKIYLALQPSERTVAHSAATIYAAYVAANRVNVGEEQHWMRRAVDEAIDIARLVDDSVHGDEEMG